MKIIKKILAFSLIISVLCSFWVSASANEAPEQDDVISALVWSDYSTMEYDTVGTDYPYLYESAWVRGRDMQSQGEDGVWRLDDELVLAEAKRVAKKVAELPEGKRCVSLDGSLSRMLVFDQKNGNKDLKETYIWFDKGEEMMQEFIDKFFAALKAELDNANITLDYVWTDWEDKIRAYEIRETVAGKIAELEEANGPEVSLTAEEREAILIQPFKEIEADARYAEEIRPALEEYGFPFVEKYGSELSQLALSDTDCNEACKIWDGVIKRRMESAFNEHMTENIQKYFPDIKHSNYGYMQMDAWYKVPELNNHKAYWGGNFNGVGTHSSKSSYGQPFRVYLEPSGGDSVDGNYALTQFNVVRYEHNVQRAAYLSTDGNKIQPWVGPFDYIPHKLTDENRGAVIANTPYYTEAIYHLALLNPDPFLVFGFKDGFKDNDGDKDDYIPEEQWPEKLHERAANFSDILREVNSLVGYKDRASLVDELVSWTKPYMISGMRANGRDIYRITPDISAGVTKESFCTDTGTPTFEIDGDTITFPDGKILTPETTIDSYGYWVEMPMGIEPVIDYKNLNGTMKIKQLEVYDTDKGILLENLASCGESGLTVRCSSVNGGTEDEDYVLVMAQYNEHGLTSVDFVQSTALKAGEEKIFIKEIPASEISADTEKIVFMLWDAHDFRTLYRKKYELVKG